ncbi:MAG: hypothetical protein ABSF64_12380 [Bryobacteraceae bacterium]|jgi:hypothetical protein
MSSPATIGFRAHSGWAAAVALTVAADAPVVIARRRIEMREPGAKGPSQPYHAAVGLEIGEARQLVENCAARAAALATTELRGMVEDLGQLGHPVVGCGLLLGSGRPLPPLEKILASHPMLHTAEGELFRAALRAASRECGLPLTAVQERLLGDELKRQVAGLGKAIGPPWRQDEKLAAVVAWMALGGAASQAADPLPAGPAGRKAG